MLIRFYLIVAAAIVWSHYDSVDGELPDYIKKALKEKDGLPTLKQREKTRLLSNLTIQDVFEKIKDITRSLSLNAKRNGYKVDYKFRILD